MKKYLPCLIALTLLGVAHASPVHRTQIEDEAQDLSVPLSPNPIDVQIAAEQTQRERANKPKGSMELGVSSWQPSNLQLPSRISTSNSFNLSGPPALNLNGIEPLSQDFSLKTGVGFVALQRTGTLDAAGISVNETQTAYVPFLRAGVEYAPVYYSSRVFRPFASAAILPTAVITGRSAFDDGQTDFGVAGELELGTLVHLSKTFDVNVGVSEEIGKAGASDLSGFGVNAGVRMPL